VRIKDASLAKSEMNWIFVGKLPTVRHVSSGRGTFIYVLLDTIEGFLVRCRFTHDIPAYLVAKAHDLHIPELSQFSDSPPFAPETATLAHFQPANPSIDSNTVCPIFAATGECRQALLVSLVIALIQLSLLDTASSVVSWEVIFKYQNQENLV
jgi:hypothetical protein